MHAPCTCSALTIACTAHAPCTHRAHTLRIPGLLVAADRLYLVENREHFMERRSSGDLEDGDGGEFEGRTPTLDLALALTLALTLT